MTTAPLLVASLLATSAPKKSPDVEPTPEAATTQTSAGAEPKHKGVGLAATAGALGVASLSVTATRSILLRLNCPLDSTAAAACRYDFGSDIGLAATQWTLNFAVLGFAPAAGIVMGRHHAWLDARSGRQRNTKGLRAGGGALIGVGAATFATSVALAFVLPARCVEQERDSGDPLEGDRCLLRSFPAWTMLNWTSFAMMGSGAGMVGYANAYDKKKRAVAELRFSPQAGLRYAGLGLSGRF